MHAPCTFPSASPPRRSRRGEKHPAERDDAPHDLSTPENLSQKHARGHHSDDRIQREIGGPPPTSTGTSRSSTATALLVPPTTPTISAGRPARAPTRSACASRSPPRP